MHFVGLAAGRGKSLNPLTNIMQKCMYPIAGVPFLEYTLREVAEVSPIRIAGCERGAA